MTRIFVFGSGGRMGRAIAAIAGARDDVEIVDREPDVFIDFSVPSALDEHLNAAVAAGRPVLVGTTGLTDDHHRAIDEAAAKVAVLQAANTSFGVAVLRALVEQAALLLGPDWDAEILEMHHRNKLDTPSGTALLLGASVNRGRGAESTTALNRFDRMQEGPHEREKDGVYYASLRGGTVAGDHLVILAGDDERIELGHRAESRSIFAKGAVRAALWLKDRPPGRYTMADVLGL
ncbi:MAG TPA: 4-hydroxy-tetrahydrodipicolinate reductase [Allosphingosinicella sp.]|jgi:4-hydroxy-tetrahydrodipicolinate reductase|nr:4-hydroxy-tetrahydrodipicolinate reductase [Allosphingosinicella sp.]